MSLVKIAVKNGIGRSAYFSRLRRGWDKERAAYEPTKKKYTGDYAIYKKDEIVVMGTRKECAEFLGVSEAYVHWMTTGAGKRRLATRKDIENATMAIKLDE